MKKEQFGRGVVQPSVNLGSNRIIAIIEIYSAEIFQHILKTTHAILNGTVSINITTTFPFRQSANM